MVKNKNQNQKSPKSRPKSTSELNQPLLPSSGATTASTVACSFSPAPDHSLFAHISNQVHQQRLRIYNASATAASSSSLVTDFLLNSLGGASCLSSQWVRISTQSSKSAKRRKHDGEASEENPKSSQLLLALGLTSGQIHLLNPALAQSVAVLDASNSAGSSTSSAADPSITSMSFSAEANTLFACSKSGWISSFDLSDVKLGADSTPLRPITSWRPDTKAAVQIISSQRKLVLSAHHSIALTDTSPSDNKLRATFTGHASPVTHLEWVSETTFISAGEGDRVVSLWSFDDTDANRSKTITGRAIATAALDGPVRALTVFRASKNRPRTLITIITQTGSVRVYGLPSESPASQSSPNKKKAALLPSLDLLAQDTTGASSNADWIDVRLVDDKLRLARLIRGAKVSIEEVVVLDQTSGELKKQISLPLSGSKGVLGDGGILSADADETQLTGGVEATQRYVEAPKRPQGLDQNEAGNGLEEAEITSTSNGGTSSRQLGSSLEPTLAERLNELGFKDPSLEDDDEEEIPNKKDQGALMNEASLASSLSQALHSGDTSLLSSCLNHNDPALIRNTVRKISAPLSVKLLEECVSRLNGVGGSHVSKGTMGSQKARGLMEWVRATLLNHMGYLMSLPNLVSRLSSLHATLTARLETHERLLALNGRLELVLSQIEARAAYMAQASDNSIQVQGVKFGKKTQGSKAGTNKKTAMDMKKRQEGKKWVEESDDDDDDDGDAMDVDEMDDGILVRGEQNEDGDVHEIALGREDSEDDEEDSDDEDDEGPLRRRRQRNGRMSDGNTSADSDEDEDEEEDDDMEDVEGDDDDDEEDDIEAIEAEEGEDDDEEEEDDESDIEGEGASDMEDDEDEEEYDDEEEGGKGGANGMFDLEAEEGTDEDDEE